MPARCCSDDSMLPVEKQNVPSNAKPSPSNVSWLASWPDSSGQNSNTSPEKPTAPATMTRGAIRVPNHSRAFNAFHSVAAENTTDTRPLGIHCVAV